MRGLPATFWYIFTGALVNRLGGFVVPFLAIYLTKERHYTVAEAGYVVSLYGAGSFASGPVGGWLADRFGRRPTLAFALVASACAMLQLGFARNPWHVAFSTMLLGFIGDLYRPAMQAAVADLVPQADRPRAYGYIYWAVNVGFAISAVLAGLLARRGYWILFAGDAVTTFLFALIVLARVPETRPGDAHTQHLEGGFFAPWSDGILVSFLAIQLIVAIIFYQGNVALPIDMRAHGVDEAGYGMLVALNGVMIVVIQPFAVAWVPKQPRNLMLALGALLTGTGFGLTGLVGAPFGYAMSIVVWTLGEIVLSPISSALVADLAPPHLRGRYQGAFWTIIGLSSLFGPTLALWWGCFAGGIVAALLQLGLAPRLNARLRATGPPASAP
jgi:MFS family permease